MKTTTFNFYTFMFLAASLLLIALVKEIPFQFPLHQSIIFFFLALLGVLANFFSVMIEEQIAEMRYEKALIGLQTIILILGVLLVFGSDIAFLGGMAVTLPTTFLWLIFQA